jgi:thymidylate synthase (FAD)
MEVKLINYTPIEVADLAISKCWGTECYSGDKMRSRMDRVANKHKHGSTIEHLVYSFDIDGISRACLQELARHRIASYSVKSSRYTLKELKGEKEEFYLNESDSKYAMQFWDTMVDEREFYTFEEVKRASKYIVFTGIELVDLNSINALETLRQAIQQGISNDIAKYCMPESYKTSLVMTINARSLQNFLSLRTDKSALWEIQSLGKAMYEVLPEDHKFLFQDYVK